MQRSPNVPPIFSLQRDTTASDALLRDISDVLKENKTFQLAILEQQNQLHDSLRELGRSLLTNREERHTDVEELSQQVDGLREDLNLLFDGTKRSRVGRRMPRRPGRVQTPGPMRQSPDLVDSTSVGEDPLEAGSDPNLYQHSDSHTGQIRGTALAPPSNNLRPQSRQQSSQGSSRLTYVTDDPVVPPPPPGFVPYPGQGPVHPQSPFPTPRVPFQQSSRHSTPVVPPPPQIRYHRDRASNKSRSD